jgi:hypothetical protein
MRRILSIGLVLAIVSATALVVTASMAASSGESKIFVFTTMVGVSGAFLGSSMPLRGIGGGGLPWVISEARATLKSNGQFDVEVEGLVLDPNNATAQARGIAGTNPAPFFFATLSCIDNTGAVTNTNTSAVSASTSGNAEIEQTIPLPASCFAPIVLVRGSFTGAPVGPWFAASGF